MKNYPNLTVDLTNCDKEPIQVIGRIQPHGCLFILNKQMIVEQVSTNASEITKTKTEEILGKSFTSLIQNDVSLGLNNSQNPQIVKIEGETYFGFIHRSGDKIIVEIEPFNEINSEKHLVYNHLFAQFNSRMNVNCTVGEIGGFLTNLVQEVIDYDRVVVFQFDESWNAETIAETIKPGVESYLNHYFPASDIPAPARALLEEKHVRQIPSVGAQPHDIIPYLNPSNNQPTNIIRSELRNPSEIHTEYLENMGVKASLSISITVNNKLWGLISCSNSQPVFIDYWRRSLCLNAAHSFAHIIPSLQEKRDYQQFLHLKEVEELLIAQATSSGDIIEGLFNQNLNILELTSAIGVALYMDNKLITRGRTPNDSQILEIIEWLAQTTDKECYCTIELSKELEPAKDYKETGSGLMTVELSRSSKEYILYFKPEIKETINWAGNPHKPQMGSDKRIHPRKSFESWQEVVDGKSAKWSKNETEIAKILLKDIVATRIKHQSELLESLYKKLTITAEDLRFKNLKLEEFNNIVTHNLRSPMITISSLYSYYEKEPTVEKARFVMEKMKLVSNNMLSTLEDLNAILQIRVDHQLKPEELAFQEIIERETQNQTSKISETDAIIKLELSQPTINIPKVYIESIIHNLLSNALKYHSPKRQPQITIKSWKEEGRTSFSVSDNGLGIDLEKFKDKMFGLYKTFHRNKDSKGLGLYLTKLQIESLGGTISVNSELDKGTTFIVKV